MVGHRGLTDEQSFADLLVLQSFADQRDDLSFAVGQRLDLRGFRIGHRRFGELLNHAAHHRTLDPDFTLVDLHDRFQKLIGGVIFQDDTHRAAADRPAVSVGVLYAGKNKDAGLRTGLAKLGQKCETVVVAEQQVEDDHVRFFAGRAFQCFVAIACLRDNAHSLIVFNEHAQSAADHNMIVNYHYVDRRRSHSF